MTSGVRLANQGQRWVYYKIVLPMAFTAERLHLYIFLFSFLNGRDANIVSTFDQCAPVTMVAGVKRKQKIKRAAVLIQFQNYFQGNDN